MPRRTSNLLLAFLALVWGCESATAPVETVRVWGRVTWHGQPMRRGTLVFSADPAKNDHQEMAVGILHFDGTYELTTPEGFSPRPGWYRVTIVSDEPHQPLPAKLADPSLSGLKAAISAPGPQRCDWNLP